ncbi:ATP-binding protein [Dyadobacter subterraneus]|uniref:ATP-binding protein n=1 Tax=Dyadobacter subterraneus TaxID=2773304 RepID=A0ABR9W8U6_9BACT|nr:ATP-binding protein [Dyadobacter subterraneus]MBE9461903.1 ATP-binding protein [Dyadobacter subterraneus]
MNKHNPYSDSRFIGFVTMVAPYVTSVHFPSSVLLKKFFNADEGFHALTGKYIVIEGSGYGFIGKIIEISLPEKERLNLTETRFEKDNFHPVGKIEIVLCFNNYELQAQKGLDQLPPVGAKVYLCSNDFLRSLLIDFGKSRGKDDTFISLAHLPNDEANYINVSAQALFGRHCAIVGTTGGGKSWTVAKLVQEVVKINGKAILIDATGEYSTLQSNEKIEYLRFNSGNPEEGIYFNYKGLRETDLYALFRPTGQAQIPKLQEAMKSLRLIEILATKGNKTANDNEISNPDAPQKFWDVHPHQGVTLLAKASNSRNRLIKAYKENLGVYNVDCQFDISALALQINNECVKEFSNNDNFGSSDTNALGFCQTLISRILVTVNSKSFKETFGFGNENKPDSEFSSKVNEFLHADSKKNVLILSVAEVPSEHKLREILVNSIGRFLLEKAISKQFKKSTPADPKRSVLLFLDEAHLFLNKRIRDEYSIEVELDAFERIAKECRKFGLFLVLSTQMPRDIPKGVLSQMGTFIVHRLINQQDREAIEYACSEANKSSLSFLPILGSGEAMLTGVDFPMPIILKIQQPAIKPDSGTPSVF